MVVGQQNLFMKTTCERKAVCGHLRFNWLGIVWGIFYLSSPAFAQVNSGSDGHDGVLNVTGTRQITIDMADHPDGIYHYTSVEIEPQAYVGFIRNANNSPVVWLVQSNCIIRGVISLTASPEQPGPGGFFGGMAGPNATAGRGPGGGPAGQYGGEASYGSLGNTNRAVAAGVIYGNQFLLPLIGGSGGGGATQAADRTGAGGNGGGAILIAAGGEIALEGSIQANGFVGNALGSSGGTGSGGAVRLVANRISGVGQIFTQGGSVSGGLGRVRLDALIIAFRGSIVGEWSQGFQPIILPGANDNVRLQIASVGGFVVPDKPFGGLSTPDIVLPGSYKNPVPIIVRCSNVPLNTPITVEIWPANSPAIQSVAVNNQGTLASSTAIVSVDLPRGGGTIHAKLITEVGIKRGAMLQGNGTNRSLAATGWTADGERLASLEVSATLGRQQQITYSSESGKRYPIPLR